MHASSETEESPFRKSLSSSRMHGLRPFKIEELRSETSLQSFSTSSDDFAEQEPKSDELNPSGSSSSDLISLCFDPNSSNLHDPSGHDAKESEAKVHDSTSNEKEPPSNPPPLKINFEPKSIFRSALKKPSQLDLPFIDSLHGGSTSNETSSETLNSSNSRIDFDASCF